MAEDLGERTEEATPRRRQEAREEGNVAKSQDFSAAMLLLAASLTVWAAASTLLGDGAVLLGQTLSFDIISDPLTPEGLWPLVTYLGRWSLGVVAPVLLIVWAAGALTHMGQIGVLFAPKVLQPKLSKLSPLKGFQRIFGLSGLVRAMLDTGKVIVVVTVAVVTIMQHEQRVVLLPQLTVLQCVVEIGTLMLDLAMRVLAVLLLLGLLDLLYQRWKHSEDLKMTRQEVQDEMKQTEGDPHVKRRRLRMQQQIAMQRVGAVVPKADVIVTNPEHISIAIQYDETRMNAPRVVAKGVDHLALRIRQIALRHGVPIVERKPLARALYHAVDAGQEIPPEFYKAVAEILAYVYRLDGKGAMAS